MTGLSIRSRAPAASAPTIARVMRAVGRADTKPEVELRRNLYGAGLRFRKDYRPAPGFPRADIAFPSRLVVVFVDGCFWHGCPVHFSLPKVNSGWWDEKIMATIERDHRQTKLLEENGWTVVRVWEHEPPYDAAQRIANAVKDNKERLS
jgi:DNA mismatch endonuclease (patch repair protein)